MKKDIPNLKVTNLAIAIVPREKEQEDEELWDTYLVNMKDSSLKSVLVSSKGYGSVNGEQLKTTTLRHFFEEIAPLSCVKIEPIQAKLFSITNEYWVSFSLGDYMYDKKYIFVRGSINKENFTIVPYINQKGVMIK